MDKVSLGQGCLPVLRFIPFSNIPPMPHTHLHITAALHRKIKGRSLGIFRKNYCFGNRGSLDRKYFDWVFKRLICHTCALYVMCWFLGGCGYVCVCVCVRVCMCVQLQFGFQQMRICSYGSRWIFFRVQVDKTQTADTWRTTWRSSASSWKVRLFHILLYVAIWAHHKARISYNLYIAIWAHRKARISYTLYIAIWAHHKARISYTFYIAIWAHHKARISCTLYIAIWVHHKARISCTLYIAIWAHHKARVSCTLYIAIWAHHKARISCTLYPCLSLSKQQFHFDSSGLNESK